MRTCHVIAQLGIIPLAILSIFIAMMTISDDVVNYPNQNDKLLLVQVIFSNGHQEAHAFLPKSSSDSNIYWLNESSILALRGQKRAYKLGKAIKNIYQLYLQNYDFTPDLVYSSTGYLNVLQATLQCVHAGLFPTFPGAQIINNNLDWRPIPYDVFPKNDDLYIYQMEVLKAIRILEVNENSNSSSQGIPDGKKLKKTLDMIRNIVKFNATLSDCVMINDYLNREVKFVDLPNEWTDIWPHNSNALANEFWNHFAINEKQTAVPLFNEFLKNIQAKVSGILPKARKVHLFSGHRLNIVAILSALKDWNSNYGTIAHCSYILLELVQEIETGFYKMYFYFGNGTDLEHPQQFTPKGCTKNTCTIFEFTKIVNSLTLL